MAASIFALLGGLVALYLLLYGLHLSPLICPVAGCETVQNSPYSKLFGFPVAGYGLVVFIALLALALFGLYRERLGKLPIDRALLWLSGLGLIAYLPLTYLELFVIHAICFWCVVSSLMMLGVFCSALAGRPRSGRVMQP